MGEKCGYKTPTPADSLEQQIIDPMFPKNEREWWASEEITRLRAEVEALRADAERYRWLRNAAGRGAAGSIFDNFNGAAVDECIDAARAVQGGEHGR